jgi:hypothetical protein
MNTIVPYAVWAAIIIMGLGLVGMLLFGIRSILHGKINLLTAAIILIPIVLLAVLGVVFGDWAVAGIWTIVLMFALAVIGLLLSGIRGLFA